MQKQISQTMQGITLLILCVFGAQVFAQEKLAPVDQEPSAVQKVLIPVDQESLDDEAVKITIMMYSGRPNPTMIVRDRNQIREINKLYADSLTNKQSAKTPEETHAVLGYTGIRIEPLNGSSGNTALTRSGGEIMVNRGRMKVGAASTSQAKLSANAQLKSVDGTAANQTEAVSYDPNKTLEKYLIGLAKNQGVLDEYVANVVETSIDE